MDESKRLIEENELLKEGFKAAEHLLLDYLKENKRLEKELEQYRATSALNSAGVNMYKENQEMKQVIKSVGNFLESASRTMENVNITFLIQYIENLEKVAKK